MRKTDKKLLLAVAGLFASVGCSAADTAGSRNGTGTQFPGASGTTGSGASGASSFGTDFGNTGMNTTGGGFAGTTAPKPQPVGPVDASAAPFMKDDTGGSGIDAGTLGKLKLGTGMGTCSVQMLYPYEGTLFPGGLTPPIFMWTGNADAAYAHFVYDQSTAVDYQFAAKTSSPGEFQIPRDAWNEITRRTPGSRLTVVLSFSAAGAVSSCSLHFRVAPGNMIGALYYNTYQAPASLGGVADQGAVMRLSLGDTAEIYKQYTGQVMKQTGPCISCHSVSFNGRVMVASYHDYWAQQFHVEKYDVTMQTQPTTGGMVNNANFGALTPDGSRILAMGNPQCTGGANTFPRGSKNFPLVEGPDVARVLATDTGANTNATGLSKDHYMWMPQFSPDGNMVVFNDAKPDASGGTDRRELAVMEYNAATNAFSNLRTIVSAGKINGIATPSLPYNPAPTAAGALPCGVNMCGPDGMPVTDCTQVVPPYPGDVGAIDTGSCSGPCYPAWPFFTPDGKAVIFSMTSEPDFASAMPGRDTPAKSELWYVDIETGEIVRLDNANKGLKDIDATNNYYPTVMPVAVGGFFWVFWTAVRDYGTKVAGRDTGGGTPDSVAEAIKKRIWAAAIKPKVPPKGEVQASPVPLKDPSSPGFYVDGQSDSGNVRAFAALNPCLANGASCESGLDCCCGYCLMAAGQATGVCNCEPPKCAKINEKCDKTTPCCPADKPTDPQPMCIGGFCGFLSVE